MERYSIAEDDILKLQEVFECCHDAHILRGEYNWIFEGKRRSRKMERPRRLPVAKMKTATQGDLTIKTIMSIRLMIGIIRMIVTRITMTHHAINGIIMTAS